MPNTHRATCLLSSHRPTTTIKMLILRIHTSLVHLLHRLANQSTPLEPNNTQPNSNNKRTRPTILQTSPLHPVPPVHRTTRLAEPTARAMPL